MAAPAAAEPPQPSAEGMGVYRPRRPRASQFLACGLLEQGFARIRCDACAHEYLLAFSCKARYFCPSCHAKRLVRKEDLLLPQAQHRIDPRRP